MAKIEYDFSHINGSLSNLNNLVKDLENIKTKINAINIDIPEISGKLTAAKNAINSNIDVIIERFEDNLLKAKALCADHELHDSKVGDYEFLNKDFQIESVHLVKSGDTLSHIAAKNNTTVDAIVDANKSKIKNADLIYAGDTIVIPKSNKVTSEEVKQKDVTKGNSVISEEIETFTLKEKQQTSGLISDSNLTDKKNEEVSNYKNTNIQINYRTSTIDGNSVVAGNSGYTINEVMTKIKESCEKNNIGEHWVDVAAISLWETGTYSSAAFTKNNPGGLSYADGSTRYSFNTLDEGIDAFVSNLSKNYYGEGRTTLSSISTKYCPGTADNWAKNVNTMKKQIERCL